LSYPHEQDNGGVKCECPAGFIGDGVKNCAGEIFRCYLFIYLFAFPGVNLEVLWLSRALSTYTQNRILDLVFNIVAM